MPSMINRFKVEFFDDKDKVVFEVIVSAYDPFDAHLDAHGIMTAKLSDKKIYSIVKVSITVI